MKHGGNVWQGGHPSHWLDFSANLRPEGMPEWVKSAISRASENVRYYPDPDMGLAASGLAAYAGVSDDMILPAAGGIAAIDLALSQNPGRVITDRHTFGEYALRAYVQGRECVTWDGSQLWEGDTRVICNPNNPTGTAMSREEILNTYKSLKKSGCDLIADEAFIDYCPDVSVRRDAQEGLSIVGSLTKILCIPGVRLGYVCAGKEAISCLKRKALPWALNAFAARIAAELPEHLEEIRRDASLNEYRRDLFCSLLEDMGAQVQPSNANFLLCDFGRDMSDAVWYLKTRNILVRECASFGLGANYLRLAVRTEEENRLLTEELKKWLAS